MIFMFHRAKLESLLLEKGDEVQGKIRPPKDQERYFALVQIDTINGETPDKAKKRKYYLKI